MMHILRRYLTDSDGNWQKGFSFAMISESLWLCDSPIFRFRVYREFA